mmetsp:Transcript_87053/g.281865  ORF Transcript_87053/g.281865 Transcript_87053/m.281865 type:complete len:208 (-) Transcript_87053:1090-1713(-)
MADCCSTSANASATARTDALPWMCTAQRRLSFSALSSTRRGPTPNSPSPSSIATLSLRCAAAADAPASTSVLSGTITSTWAADSEADQAPQACFLFSAAASNASENEGAPWSSAGRLRPAAASSSLARKLSTSAAEASQRNSSSATRCSALGSHTRSASSVASSARNWATARRDSATSASVRIRSSSSSRANHRSGLEPAASCSTAW